MKDREELAKEISLIAAQAQNEEELKMRIEPLLQQHLSSYSDIEVHPEYEKQTGFRGKMDAVYGHLIIEYKRPGEFSNKTKLKKAAEQLTKYLKDTAGEEEEALKRVAGVGLDGQSIFFLRYWPTELTQTRPFSSPSHLGLFGTEKKKGGGFQLLGPHEITPESLDEFFRYLNALHRMPLIAESLSKVFGPGSETAQRMVGSFYENFCSTDLKIVETLFKQWEYTFGVAYGEETKKAEKDVPELAEGYGLPKSARLKPSLFAVHTYFALIMKLLAAEVLSLQQGSLAPSLIHQLPGSSSDELKLKIEELEKGGTFANYGVQNFLEGDYFRWYLNIWNQDLAESIKDLATKLSWFEPATPTLRPLETRDLLKKLYQYLVPKKLRHDLGEYYTPDWIAERLLNQLGYKGNPDTRILDPSCGSGTFLILALGRARQYMQEHFLDRNPKKRKECAQKILHNIVGFDLNPLAVIAARTNYLLALGDLIREVSPIEIPVYMCDSILTPTLHKREGQFNMFEENEVEFFYLPTSVGDFPLPKAVLDKGILGQITSMIEMCVKNSYSAKDYFALVKQETNLESEGAYSLLESLFRKIAQLESEGRNGIWARLLKNSFAPVLQPQFDLIAGNPPWVNWESLPAAWRELSKDLWVNYGLFSLKGHEARLGGGKKDLAMLFTYGCADHYLKDKGQLGFVITQTLFKSVGAGDGFREFQLGDKLPLRVKHVDDMVELNPFEGATNRTAIMVLIKSLKTNYPVPYTLWRKTKSGRIPEDTSLIEVAEEWSERKRFFAKPVNPEKTTSPWITARPQALNALQKIVGQSDYKAYAGSCTWLNGAFWLNLLDKRPDGLLIVNNLHDIGRKEVPPIKCALEPDLIFPLLRGREILKWKAAPQNYLLLAQDPQNRVGWPEEKMKIKWPYTYNYLKQLEKLLRGRSGYKKYFKPTDPFWSIYNVGPYTMSPYKVVWKEQANFLTCAVCCTSSLIDKKKLVIPDHKLMFIPIESLAESHYLCALLNSSPSQLAVKSYIIETSTSTHILDNIAIPQFIDSEKIHKKISNLSQKAHGLVESEKEKELKNIEDKIDQSVAELWGITPKELEDIHRSLEELK